MGKSFLSISRIVIAATAFTFVWLITCMLFNGSADTQMPYIDTDSPYRSSKTGLGIDLGPLSGTASLSFRNGSVLPVAKIDGDQNYKDTMRKLSLKSAQHIHPPYDNMLEEFRDMPRQQLRRFRKYIGFPASGDVGSLANMIIELRARAAESMGLPTPALIDSAVVSVMHLAAVYMEDIDDACLYARINRVRVDGHPGYPPDYQSHVAYAGYGFGLCQNYTDFHDCHQEETEMPPRWVQLIAFSSNTIFVGFPRLASADWLDEPLDITTIDLRVAGFDPDSKTQNNVFWDAIHDNIVEITNRVQLLSQPSELLLIGDHVDGDRFLAVLKHGLDDLQQYYKWPALPRIHNKDPVYVAANGAAELMRRSYYKPLGYYQQTLEDL